MHPTPADQYYERLRSHSQL